MKSPLEQLRSVLPRPSGPFRVVEGVEAEAAFTRARLANRALLARYEELIGSELVEVHPVLLGGDPETIENKRAVDGQTHRELVAFWAQWAPSANAYVLAPAEPSPDYRELGSPDETVVLTAGQIRLKLWSEEQAAARDRLGPAAPYLLGSDGSGTAYAWGRSDAGEDVHELPFIPLLSQSPRFVSPTLSGLLDVLERECRFARFAIAGGRLRALSRLPPSSSARLRSDPLSRRRSRYIANGVGGAVTDVRNR